MRDMYSRGRVCRGGVINVKNPHTYYIEVLNIIRAPTQFLAPGNVFAKSLSCVYIVPSRPVMPT